jgi:hypothetical protein
VNFLSAKFRHSVEAELRNPTCIPKLELGNEGLNLLKIVLKEAGISRDEWIRR